MRKTSVQGARLYLSYRTRLKQDTPAMLQKIRRNCVTSSPGVRNTVSGRRRSSGVNRMRSE